MGAINPISRGVQVPPELQSSDHSNLGLVKAEEVAKDHGFFRSIGDIISKSLSLANTTKSNTSLSAGIKWLSPIGTFFSFIDGLNGIVTIIKNLTRDDVQPEDKVLLHLGTAAAATDVIDAGNSLLSTLDSFKVISLANIAKGMGNIPVIGLIFSVFTILGEEIEIAISLIKIDRISEKVKRVYHKIEKQWNKPIDATVASAQLDRIVTKQTSLVKEAENLKKEIGNKEPKLHELFENYTAKKGKLEAIVNELKSRNKIAQVFGSIVPKWNLRKAKVALEKELAGYNKLHASYSATATSHAALGEKKEKWENIHQKLSDGTATKTELQSLEAMRAAKVDKWNQKKIVHFFDLAMEWGNVGLRVLAIAAAITGIALAIIYSAGAIPTAALITLGAIGLSLCAAKMIRTFYLKHLSVTDPHRSVTIPSLQLATS